jgi:NADPH-dependent curcumin reductase CurA
MRGSAVGVITASKSKSFPIGSYAYGQPGWTELAIVKEKHLEKIDVPHNGKVTDILGVLGECENPSHIFPSISLSSVYSFSVDEAYYGKCTLH